MFDRLKALWRWRRPLYGGGWLKKGPHSLQFGTLARRRRRQRLFGILVVLLASLASAVYALGYASDHGWDLSQLYKVGLSSQEATPEQAPEQPDTTPAAAAYRALASELPGIDPEDVQGVYRSALDPSWASVRITAPDEESTYVFFLQRGEDNLWKARKSIRADEPDHPENEKVVLDGVPKDLVESIYPQNLASDSSGLLAETVEPGTLLSIKPAEVPPPDPVTEDVPESERERVDEGVDGVQQTIKDYDGVAGVYVRDLNGGWGYGVRPDEVFFSASVAKLPIMVAVYRRIDEGSLSLNDTFETKSEDWAAGAGWLQWEPAGKSLTVKDYLSMMMTQSDNVATNALTRVVGGPEYVNGVARSMGAYHTVLQQKVSSERSAVLSLDNQTTPRDMVTMLQQISSGAAASPESCQDMVDLMHQNHLESWLKEGLPKDTKVANKAGWLYRVYNEVAIVWHEDHPYVVAILSKQGPEDTDKAKAALKKISKSIWEAQDES